MYFLCNLFFSLICDHFPLMRSTTMHPPGYLSLEHFMSSFKQLYFPLKHFLLHTDGNHPDILQFASANVISVEDCQDDHSYIDEQHICIRDSSGQEGACFVSSLLPMIKGQFNGPSFIHNCHNTTLCETR